MKYLFLFIAGLTMSAAGAWAQDETEKGAMAHKPLFTWDLLWAGSWEESKSLLNRGDFRLGLIQPGLTARVQALDKHTLNFELDQPWGEPSSGITSVSEGLYHKATGSRLLYGVLDEWGLPARIRSPWIRSAPYTENHKPIMADLRTTTSTTKTDELYLYLSSPRLSLNNLPLFENMPEMAMRGFGSAQFSTVDAAEGNFAPAFSGGLETIFGRDIDLLLEGFYTGKELPAHPSSTWFSDPPPLPDRDFRLGAAALLLNTPYVSFASDWAWSETFAWGPGVYGNVGIRVSPPFSWNRGPKPGKPGPWSLSLAADGMSERYVGRDGTSPGGGLRTAGKVEWKGPRSSLFKVNTTLRGPALDEPFERSSSGVYYRFPAPAANAANSAKFPLRVSRISLNADRNASNLKKIYDDIDGALGLSLSLPPMLLPPVLLPASARVKNPKPKSYPLSINLSATIKTLGSSAEVPPPYPFLPLNTEQGAPMEFDSAKESLELLWSPGIFQFRTRWGYTSYAKKDNQWDGSISAAVRFKHGRFSVKFAWPVFPEKWNCTLSWRLEK
jgi:hypothetical protein